MCTAHPIRWLRLEVPRQSKRLQQAVPLLGLRPRIRKVVKDLAGWPGLSLTLWHDALDAGHVVKVFFHRFDRIPEAVHRRHVNCVFACVFRKK